MTRYLLDTNIISNIAKTVPSASLLAWMAEQIDETVFIASLTVAEIRRGVLEKLAGSVISLTHGFPARRDPRRSLQVVCYHSTRRRA